MGSLRAGIGGVQVHRSGDGLATAVFTITLLKSGNVPLLSVDGAPLRRAVPIADSVNDTYTDATSVAIEELAPGGVDLTPLPGRYLTRAGERVGGGERPRWRRVDGAVRSPRLAKAAAPRLLSSRRRRGGGRGRTRGRARWRSAAAPLRAQPRDGRRWRSLWWATQCRCLREVPKEAARATDISCDTPCSAGEGELCGGSTAASVYRLPSAAAAAGGACAFGFAPATPFDDVGAGLCMTGGGGTPPSTTINAIVAKSAPRSEADAACAARCAAAAECVKAIRCPTRTIAGCGRCARATRGASTSPLPPPSPSPVP